MEVFSTQIVFDFTKTRWFWKQWLLDCGHICIYVQINYIASVYYFLQHKKDSEVPKNYTCLL